MSRETWLMMVQVAQTKTQVPPRRRGPQTVPRLLWRSVREDHYELLLAARY